MKRAAWLLLLVVSAAQAATFTILNSTDAAGVGLNDPTPFTPVGGNSATTLGQARMNVFKEAGRIWAAQLTSSVPIRVQASFASLTCSASTGTLGSAGAHNYFTAPGSTFLVPAALADSITGTDNSGRDDIFAQFNSDVRAGNTACLNGTGFYLGLDHATGQGIDLLAVTLHEFGHGLGFVSLVDVNGNGVGTNMAQLSAFDQYVYSETLGQFWTTMTPAQRATSLTDNGKLVFNSPSLNGVISQLTGGLSNPGGHLRIYAPTTFSDGSSGSHFDTPSQWVVGGSTRSLLMEPNITLNPLGVTDFTGCVLKDMGWLGTRCPDSTGVPANQPPVANAQTVSAIAGTALSITLTGSDPEGAPITYAVVGNPTSGTLSGTAPNLSYTASAAFSGADSFTFRVNDGIVNSVAATVTINVRANTPPIANAQTVSTAAGAAVSITLSGSDPEGASLTYAVVSNPVSGTLTGTAPNLSYAPNAGFSGADSFTFRTNDGALNSAIATVTINVSVPPAVTASSGGGGGGGSLDAFALFLLCLLTLAVRCVPQRCRPPIVDQ